MRTSEYQLKGAKDKEQYLQILKDSCDVDNMSREMYEYEMDYHIIFKHPKFVIYKLYANEFYIAKPNEEGKYAFFLDQIENTKVCVNSDNEILVNWNKDCDWPSVMDYISEAGFPIPFKLFKDYRRE